MTITNSTHCVLFRSCEEHDSAWHWAMRNLSNHPDSTQFQYNNWNTALRITDSDDIKLSALTVQWVNYTLKNQSVHSLRLVLPAYHAHSLTGYGLPAIPPPSYLHAGSQVTNSNQKGISSWQRFWEHRYHCQSVLATIKHQYKNTIVSRTHKCSLLPDCACWITPTCNLEQLSGDTSNHDVTELTF